MKTMRYLLGVFGKDRPGIISRVTGALYHEKANLEDVTMTLLENQFSMMMIVCMGEKAKERLGRRLEVSGAPQDLVFFWKPLPKGKVFPDVRGKAAVSYLVTAIGRDRTGIVHAISTVLSKRGLNITDLNSRILSQGPRALYALALEVDIPVKFDIRSLDGALKRLEKRLAIEISLKKVEAIQF